MTPKNKKTFQDLVFEHLTRILEMAKNEFKGGYSRSVISGSNVIQEEITDKKEEYCQLVEAFGRMLSPYIIGIQWYTNHKSNLKTLKDTYFNKETLQPNDRTSLFTYGQKRLELNHELFENLCQFLQTKDYFSAKAYITQDIVDEQIEESDEESDRQLEENAKW